MWYYPDTTLETITTRLHDMQCVRAVPESAELVPPYELKTTTVISICGIKEISRSGIPKVLFTTSLNDKRIGCNICLC